MQFQSPLVAQRKGVEQPALARLIRRDGFMPARSNGLLDGIRRRTLVTDEPEIGMCLAFGALRQGQHFMKMFAREWAVC